MLQLEGAKLREQGVTFAVVIVKPHVVANPNEAQDAIRRFFPLFGGVPVVLMAQDSYGTPTYYGRKDIARYMASVPVSSVPWRRYTFN